jgi:hypothetical protein
LKIAEGFSPKSRFSGKGLELLRALARSPDFSGKGLELLKALARSPDLSGKGLELLRALARSPDFSGKGLKGFQLPVAANNIIIPLIFAEIIAVYTA